MRDRRDAAALWFWAMGFSDRWIGRKQRRDHKTVKSPRERDLARLARELNRNGSDGER